VRPGDQDLKQKLEKVLDQRQGRIDSLLTRFGFPRVAEADRPR
jgi:hypothetical protein